MVDTDGFSLGFGGLKKISSPELSLSIDMIESVSFLKYEVKSIIFAFQLSLNVSHTLYFTLFFYFEMKI